MLVQIGDRVSINPSARSLLASRECEVDAVLEPALRAARGGLAVRHAVAAYDLDVSASPLRSLVDDGTDVMIVLCDRRTVREAAHRLRNPLAAIHNALLLLDRDPNPDQVGRCRELIGRQVTAALAILDELRGASR